MNSTASADLPSAPQPGTWRDDLELDGNALAALDRLVSEGSWNGPLIVALPRSGSTLLATLFLLARDPPGTGPHAFERYVHEPMAPVYWDDAPLSSVLDLTGGHLSGTDIIQESAYQFTFEAVARWFVRHARRPIAFTMRDPRIAWPSRWRIMLQEWLHAGPSQRDRDRFRRALDSDDFSSLGDVLTGRIPQPDNGWFAFVAVLRMCQEAEIDFRLIDNARFRAGPEAVLGALCRAWEVEYDPALVEWNDLAEALPRVVMSDLARREYPWYYRATLEGTGGIRSQDREPLALDRFPPELRGESDRHLTIDTAVAWYRLLLQRDEVIG